MATRTRRKRTTRKRARRRAPRRRVARRRRNPIQRIAKAAVKNPRRRRRVRRTRRANPARRAKRRSYRRNPMRLIPSFSQVKVAATQGSGFLANKVASNWLIFLKVKYMPGVNIPAPVFTIGAPIIGTALASFVGAKVFSGAARRNFQDGINVAFGYGLIKAVISLTRLNQNPTVNALLADYEMGDWVSSNDYSGLTMADYVTVDRSRELAGLGCGQNTDFGQNTGDDSY